MLKLQEILELEEAKSEYGERPDKIYIRRKKKKDRDLSHIEHITEWTTYFRKNPHRLITEYYGLVVHNFQKVAMYEMDKYSAYIFVGSRGVAKK